MKGIRPQINSWALKTPLKLVKSTSYFTMDEIFCLETYSNKVVSHTIMLVLRFVSFACSECSVTGRSQNLAGQWPPKSMGGRKVPVLMNVQHVSPLLSASPSEILIHLIFMEVLFLHPCDVPGGNLVFMAYWDTLPSRPSCFEDTYSYFTGFLEGLGLNLTTSLLLLVVFFHSSQRTED